MDAYDVIIVGTGAGGGTLSPPPRPVRQAGPAAGARRLSAPRARQLGLDGGVPQGEVPTPARHGTTGRGDAFTPENNYFVGGNTKFYGAALFRLRPQDFGELRHQGGISPAWPLSYQDLEPYYAAGRAPVPGARRHGRGSHRGPAAARTSPIRRSSTSRASSSCSDDLEQLGLHPFHLPIGVILDQDGNGEASRQPLHSLRPRRRLPVPGGRQGRRPGRLRGPGARIPT